MRIPVGRSQDDFWAWSAEKHGQYSVRSAYRLLAAKDAQNRAHAGPTSSISNIEESVWKVLWKLAVPPKVRVFWWRVIHNYIPSRANLHHRHIEKLSYCEVCGAQAETTFHTSIECTYAEQFWCEVKDMADVKLPNLHPRTWV